MYIYIYMHIYIYIYTHCICTTRTHDHHMCTTYIIHICYTERDRDTHGPMDIHNGPEMRAIGSPGICFDVEGEEPEAQWSVAGKPSWWHLQGCGKSSHLKSGSHQGIHAKWYNTISISCRMYHTQTITQIFKSPIWGLNIWAVSARAALPACCGVSVSERWSCVARSKDVFFVGKNPWYDMGKAMFHFLNGKSITWGIENGTNSYYVYIYGICSSVVYKLQNCEKEYITMEQQMLNRMRKVQQTAQQQKIWQSLGRAP